MNDCSSQDTVVFLVRSPYFDPGVAQILKWETRMNKGQLIEAVATELDTSKAAASRAVDAVMASITTGIKHDSGVTIVGFGSFVKKKRAARKVRNPSTGLPMDIQESMTVGFKPAQALKEEMAPKEELV